MSGLRQREPLTYLSHLDSMPCAMMALRHSSPMITLNAYVGLWPDQVDRTRTHVDDALLNTPLLDASA